jgi:hypothetical protein
MEPEPSITSYEYLEDWTRNLYQKAHNPTVGISSYTTASSTPDPRVAQLVAEMSQVKGQIGELQGLVQTKKQTEAEQSRRLQQAIDITNTNAQTTDRLKQEIEQVNSNLHQLETNLTAKFNGEIARQLSTNKQELESYLNEKVERLKRLFSFQSDATQSNPTPSLELSSPSPRSSTSPALLEAQTNETAFHLSEEYNRSSKDIPPSISRGAVEVSMSARSVAELRDRYTVPVLERERRGDYLVVERGVYTYLVPNKRNPINQHSISIIKFLYDCTGYTANYQQMMLEKPAIVNATSLDSWTLAQKGSLKFT